MTSNRIIYNRFESQSQDFRRLPLNEPEKLTVLYEWLLFGVGKFKDICLTDLTDRVEFQRNDETFTGDDAQTEFILSNSPITDGTYYVALDGVEVTEGTDYTYNATNNSIIFTVAPQLNVQIAVVNYYIGHFNGDLNEDEINIMAELMKTPFTSFQLYDSSMLTLRLTNSDSNNPSTGPHIKAVKDVAEFNFYTMADIMINDYTYRNKVES